MRIQPSPSAASPRSATPVCTYLLRRFKQMSIVLSACLSPVAMAQSPEDHHEQDKARWGIGFGVLSEQKPIVDIDRTDIAIPLIYYENQYLRVFGPIVDIKLPTLTLGESQEFNISITAEYDFGGYDDDDIEETPILHGMTERKGGFWAGAKFEWKNSLVDFNMTWLDEVSGDSNGQQFTIGLEKNLMIGHHLMLSPRISATWQNDDYIDYYYGVQAQEVLVGRDAFAGEAGTSIEYGVRSTLLLDMQMKHSIFLDLGITYLPDEITNSPLIDKDSTASAMLVYMYSF
ncbi:hypothetical protein TDB9533_04685 [Thalassocella blandensis]|nr:hypothetical protein TDB9533_04685 [Thalassocella blandensis]